MNDAPLLLCYDGSEDAKRAIRRAAFIFGERAAIVISVWQRAELVHSYQWPSITYMPDLEPLNDANETLAKGLAQEGAEIAETAGFSTAALAVCAAGPVWDAILGRADEFQVGAIVLGSRGRSGTRSMLLGSVSSTVMHHTIRPTLVVRDGASEHARGPALIAYDGSLDARVAIERAGALLGEQNVLVLTVWQHIHAALTYSWPGLPYAMDLGTLEAAAQDAATALAAEGVELAEAVGLQAAALVRRAPGPTWQTILDVADGCQASVIVLGSRGLGGLKSLMLGSVSGAVMHHSHRPLLVVRHGAIATPSEDDCTPESLAGPIIG